MSQTRWITVAAIFAVVFVPSVHGAEDSSTGAGPQISSAKEPFEEYQYDLLDEHKVSLLDRYQFELHGFLDVRSGYRLQNDRHEKDMILNEARLQLQANRFSDTFDFTYKGDFVGDLVTEELWFDWRETNIFVRPTDYMDLKLGRQIFTWGTGDLLFINDLFPKDWESFFIGRDVEYLKAPSDAAKISFFGDVNLDVVYTPQFDSDNYINGERISFYNGSLGRLSGEDAVVPVDKPDKWFRDDEIAARVYGNWGNYEVALYGYDGFWKSPGGQDASGRAIFPDLRVYGASARGPLGTGIGNLELGYYDSLDDSSGKDPMVNNSEMRYLVGYTQEVMQDLTLGLQYYVEQMMQYDEYVRSLPGGAYRKEEWRDVVTTRLTKLAMNQNLTLSLFAYYSPADADAYLRPSVGYKVTDNLALSAGGNIFMGNSEKTFFGQFEDNTNLYAGLRYSF
jgi:hypothetical protein